ncbi:MAG: hypothetical protein WA160_06960 [Pseudobdellovibrio sp.]
MILTDRDNRILLLLREQGFVTFQQILARFFKQQSNCSARLIELEKNLYITSIKAVDYLNDKNPNSIYFPYLLSLGITPKTKIYYLHQCYRRQFSETNRLLKKDLCLHQLLLNDVRFYIEDTFKDERIILNDPESKILADIDMTKRKEFTPDLTILSKKFSLAIELERTIKGQNRYMNRFWYYEDSSYTHILYFYVNESHLKSLLQYAGTSYQFGFAHYKQPQKIISNVFGFMHLKDWINKVSDIERKTNGEQKEPTRELSNTTH